MVASITSDKKLDLNDFLLSTMMQRASENKPWEWMTEEERDRAVARSKAAWGGPDA